jgi:SWI/SNF-related matrix-associated actin-dependent regulator of chromatin subfamily A member 5
MKESQEYNGPHLIVVPKSTLSHWTAELARWAPTLVTIKYHGTKEDRDNITNIILKPGQRDERRSWNVVVTTYEACNKEKNALNKFAWCYLIIDEAHRLKNETSAFSTTIRTFETRYRLLLTREHPYAEQFDEWFNLDIEDADEGGGSVQDIRTYFQVLKIDLSLLSENTWLKIVGRWCCWISY